MVSPYLRLLLSRLILDDCPHSRIAFRNWALDCPWAHRRDFPRRLRVAYVPCRAWPQPAQRL